MRVLVIEDNETSRFVIRAVLEQAGYEVVEAGDAEEAVRTCKENQIDLFVADTVLRSTNGPEVVGQLRQIFPNAPVLLVSGFPLNQLVNRRLVDPTLVDSHDVAFLQKPFMPKALLDTIDHLMKHSRPAE